jgi:ribonuclease T1
MVIQPDPSYRTRSQKLLARQALGGHTAMWIHQKIKKLGLALAMAAVVTAPALAKPNAPESLAANEVALASLPIEARQTEKLIRAGGPFPYGKDGSVFGNRERVLPRKVRGYYREYTVKTPGSRDRGARRIVCGGEQPTAPDACFYTADHYATFQRIVQ